MGTTSNSNLILLNPRWSEAERQDAHELVAHSPLQNCIWLASSGSSQQVGQSVKMIALSRSSVEASAKAVNEYFQVSAQDVFLKVLPSFHVGGLGIEIRSQISGARMLDGLRDGKWDPEYFCNLVQKEKATLASLVPTQIYDLVEQKFARNCPPSLRAILVGGAALSTSLLDKALARGWPLYPSYGLTEAGSTVAIADAKSKMEILPHLQARLSAEATLELMGSSLLSGSIQRSASQIIFEAGPQGEQWFKTADRAALNGRELSILGRAEDYIKILGEGVNLRLLRETLSSILEHLGSSPEQALLLAKFDERRGAELILILESAIESKAEEICRLFDEQVKPFERIQRHAVIEKIPRSDLGKPLLSKLQGL